MTKLRICTYIASAAIVGGLIFGGFQLVQANDAESKTVSKPTTTIESENVSATISGVQELSSVKTYLSHYVEMFNNSTPTSQGEVESVTSAGYSIGYYYYLQAMSLKYTVINVQTDNEELKKDIHNLDALSDIIMNEELKQPKGTPPTERMNQAVEHMKELLSDLSIVASGGTGEYFGVSHVGGGNAKPIEDFINGVE